MEEALPKSKIADALAAEWQRRLQPFSEGAAKSLDALSDLSTEDTDGAASEASAIGRSDSYKIKDLEEPSLDQQASATAEVLMIEESFLGASSHGQLKEGTQLFYAPSGLPLSIRNTFFDVEDCARPRAACRSQSAGARLSASQPIA